MTYSRRAKSAAISRTFGQRGSGPAGANYHSRLWIFFPGGNRVRRSASELKTIHNVSVASGHTIALYAARICAETARRTRRPAAIIVGRKSLPAPAPAAALAAAVAI